jgi:unsaturated chondroitin disaccharide hydrolase
MAPRSRSLRATPRKSHPLSNSCRLAAAALVAAALAGCGGSTSQAKPAISPDLGAVQIRLQVRHPTTIYLPAPWALSYDAEGRHVERAGPHARSLTVGPASNLIVSSRPAALLLHRLAMIHFRLKPGQFPIGADTGDHLYIGKPTYWTSGFWPGALWQAAALVGQPFRGWALQATLRHLGYEHTATHDVGFMYGQSSLNGYLALCSGGHARAGLCSRLRRSVLAAAGELVKLAATNARAGTIPTGPRGVRADTIVDSMMNIAILPWATQVTGDLRYARVAARHAQRVAALLVRPDGSTIQSVSFDRATGRVVAKHTHQGISARSTWSRGQGWAVYGFAVAAAELHSAALLRVAERAAQYVAGHLPPSGVPLWDYDAPADAPVDVSAGVITAAGLFHLVAACRALGQPCPRWRGLGRRMLGAALAHASPRPPLGLLSGQEQDEHAVGCSCNGGELMFGLSYALEAVRLASLSR